MYGVELFKSIGKHNGKQKFTCKQYEKYIEEKKEANPKEAPKYGAFIRLCSTLRFDPLSVSEDEPIVKRDKSFLDVCFLRKLSVARTNGTILGVGC